VITVILSFLLHCLAIGLLGSVAVIFGMALTHSHINLKHDRYTLLFLLFRRFGLYVFKCELYERRRTEFKKIANKTVRADRENDIAGQKP
jgi:hypothetical protein